MEESARKNGSSYCNLAKDFLTLRSQPLCWHDILGATLAQAPSGTWKFFVCKVLEWQSRFPAVATNKPCPHPRVGHERMADNDSQAGRGSIFPFFLHMAIPRPTDGE